MDSSSISSPLLTAAIDINRSHGTMRAWQFLAQLGIPATEIFQLLKDAPGPEQCTEAVAWRYIDRKDALP